MATDWKDALAALGASGAIPEGESVPEQAPEQQEEKVQKAHLRIYIDRRKRRGKEATIIEGFLCSDERLKEIAGALKRTLGIGGSAREGEILLQGDVRDRCVDELRKLGFKTRMC